MPDPPRRLLLTADIRRRLADLARAEADYRPGLDSSAIVELPKLALAEAVLAALPKPKPARAVARFPKRRRA